MPRDVMMIDFKFAEPDAIGEVLLRAADLLEQRGWCKGTVQNEAGHICSLQAICLAAGSDHTEWGQTTAKARLAQAAITRVESHVRTRDILSLCAWNNTRSSLHGVTSTLRGLACP